jgi:hypothetical protein
MGVFNPFPSKYRRNMRQLNTGVNATSNYGQHNELDQHFSDFLHVCILSVEIMGNGILPGAESVYKKDVTKSTMNHLKIRTTHGYFMASIIIRTASGEGKCTHKMRFPRAASAS